MRTFGFRLLISCVCAGAMALLSLALAQASPSPQDVAVSPVLQEGPTTQLNCYLCHADFQAAWEKGAHGRTTSDPKFKEAWEAQGSPCQCLTCHTTGYDGTTDTYKSEGVT